MKNKKDAQINQGTRKHKILKRVSIVAGVLIFAMGMGAGLYVNDYYRASKDVDKYMEDAIYVSSDKANAAAARDRSSYDEEDITIRVRDDLSKDVIVVAPEKPKAGIIFYPGGKVDYTAYVPFLYKFAEQGYACLMPEMPANLAVLSPNAADGLKSTVKGVDHWYMAGHSLGGAMAANYVAEHTDDFDGLFLMGSYATKDLSKSDLEVVTIYGSEDKVMNLEHYQEDEKNLPDTWSENVIQGGCHSYFGDYGNQDGDGKATISRDQQMSETAEILGKVIA